MNLFKSLLGGMAKTKARLRPHFEPLEDRCVPIVGAFSVPAPIYPIGVEGSRMDGVVKIGTSRLGDICSGALLNSGRHVLTAAHCVDLNRDGREDTERMRVKFELLGRTYLTWSTAITVHSRWSGGLSGGYDFAILKLPGPAPVEADRYQIYRGTDELGKAFQVVGYGRTGVGTTGAWDPATFGVKRGGYNQFDAVDVARAYLKFDFDDGTVATNRMGGLGLGGYESNTAPGDSGGPSFMSGKIAAVTTGGTDRLSRFGDVSFSGRVSAAAPWIDYVVDGILSPPGGLIPPPLEGVIPSLPRRVVADVAFASLSTPSAQDALTWPVTPGQGPQHVPTTRQPGQAEGNASIRTTSSSRATESAMLAALFAEFGTLQ